MKKTANLALVTAVTSLIALGSAMTTTSASAAEKKERLIMGFRELA